MIIHSVSELSCGASTPRKCSAAQIWKLEHHMCAASCIAACERSAAASLNHTQILHASESCEACVCAFRAQRGGKKQKHMELKHPLATQHVDEVLHPEPMQPKYRYTKK
jgi:hypothetical protein